MLVELGKNPQEHRAPKKGHSPAAPHSSILVRGAGQDITVTPDLWPRGDEVGFAVAINVRQVVFLTTVIVRAVRFEDELWWVKPTAVGQPKHGFGAPVFRPRND